MFLIENLMFLSNLSSSVGLVSEVFKNSWTVPLKPKLNPHYPRHNRHTIEQIDHSVHNNNPPPFHVGEYQSESYTLHP